MEIDKMLTISTGHITEKTVCKLDIEAEVNVMYLCVYKKADFGWFVYVPEDLEDISYDIPNDLMECLLFAKENDCAWLCLDCDGEEIEELKTYW